MTITLYTKPGCQPCRITAKKFTDAGIEFNTVDLSENPAAVEYVTEELGYQQAPVVVVDDQAHWSGLNPAKIEEVIQASKQNQ